MKIISLLLLVVLTACTNPEPEYVVDLGKPGSGKVKITNPITGEELYVKDNSSTSNVKTLPDYNIDDLKLNLNSISELEKCALNGQYRLSKEDKTILDEAFEDQIFHDSMVAKDGWYFGVANLCILENGEKIATFPFTSNAKNSSDLITASVNTYIVKFSQENEVINSLEITCAHPDDAAGAEFFSGDGDRLLARCGSGSRITGGYYVFVEFFDINFNTLETEPVFSIATSNRTNSPLEVKSSILPAFDELLPEQKNIINAYIKKRKRNSNYYIYETYAPDDEWPYSPIKSALYLDKNNDTEIVFNDIQLMFNKKTEQIDNSRYSILTNHADVVCIEKRRYDHALKSKELDIRCYDNESKNTYSPQYDNISYGSIINKSYMAFRNHLVILDKDDNQRFFIVNLINEEVYSVELNSDQILFDDSNCQSSVFTSGYDIRGNVLNLTIYLTSEIKNYLEEACKDEDEFEVYAEKTRRLRPLARNIFLDLSRFK